MARLNAIPIHWCGWIRNIGVEPPWRWEVVEFSASETWVGCLDRLQVMYPDPYGRYSKAIVPSGQTPTKGRLEI